MAGRDLIFTILGIDKASPAFDKVGRAAERAGDRLDKVGNTAIKTMAATTAASVAGGLATAAAIGGVPLLFAGMAAAALASNEQVSDSFRNLADNVVDDVKAMATPLADDLVGVANDLGRAWEDVQPVMKAVLADPALGKGVRELSAGVGDLARNAMPGLVESVRNSGPVMTGFRSLLGDVGTGTSDLLRNVSREAESSGVVIEGFGRITRTALGDVGGLLGEMSAAVAPHMGQLTTLAEQATGSVLGLASGALPVLTSAGGATAGVLSGVLGVLEPISAQLGTGVGVALAAAGGWRLLSAASGAYTKLDLPGKLNAGGLAAGVFTEGLTGSANAGERVATAGSKVGRVLGGLGTALPYVGIGVAALGLAFDAASRSAEELAQRAQNNAEGLLKGGAAADQTRKHLADLEAANRSLNAEMEALGARGDDQSEAISRLNFRLKDNRSEIAQTSQLYEAQKAKLTGAAAAQVAYNEAVEQHGLHSTEATAAGEAWRAALDRDREKQDAAARATQTHTERIIEQQAIKLGAVQAGLAYEASLLSLESAQKGLNDATTKFGADSLEARTASNQYQQQLLGTVLAIGERTKADNAAKTASEQEQLATQAQAAEILRLAAAAGTNAPPALAAMVAGLDATTLAAIGVTGRVNEAGQAVLTLPDGKEVVLTGSNADALAKIAAVNAARVLDKFFTVVMNMQTDSGGAPIAGSNRSGYNNPNSNDPGYNDGGWVGGRHLAGPSKGRDTMTVGATGGEFMVRRDRAHKNAALLEAINGGADVLSALPTSGSAAVPATAVPRAGGGTVIERHNHLTVVQAGNSVIDLLDQFDRMQALDDLATG